MKELVVLSGKGGTGKTSLTAAIAALARPVMLVDADVDAPNLHLVTQPCVQHSQDFVAGSEAVIDPERCIGCGQCARVCRFEAIHPGADNVDYGPLQTVDPVGCEGCGRCATRCPAGAIRMEPTTCGSWYFSTTEYGPMVHAGLLPGAENSGKLVSLVRSEARDRATETAVNLILTDGPPGIGCPVIASLSGAHLVLIVCEPSPSGVHDLRSVLTLTHHFGVPATVCINKWDLNADATQSLESELAAEGIPVAGRIRYGEAFSRAQRQGIDLIALGDVPEVAEVSAVWDHVNQMLQQNQRLPIHQ